MVGTLPPALYHLGVEEKKFLCKFLEGVKMPDGYAHSHKVPGSTGSRNGVEGRHFIKLWYEGGIHLWNDKLLCGTRP